MNFRFSKSQMRVNNPDAVSGIDALATIQSQYAGSPRIVQLLVLKAALMDMGRDLLLYWLHCFNPKTATGWGLDAWARIVGSIRTIKLPKDEYFGMTPSKRKTYMPDDVDPSVYSLFGILYDNQELEYASELDDEALRALVFWKAASNIGTADAKSMNALLKSFFGEAGLVYVIEIRPMYIRVVSRFELDDVHRSIFKHTGVMGRGAGVYCDWLEMPYDYFGFSDDNWNAEDGDWQPFGNGEDDVGAPFFNGAPVTYDPDAA